MLLLLFTTTKSKAQYIPLVKENVHWMVAKVNEVIPPGTYSSIFEYYSHEDTVINSTTYKKIYKRSIQSLNGDYSSPYQPISLYTLFAVLREDTLSKKVYSILFQNTLNSFCSIGQEELLYDFNLSLWDSINDNMCIATSPHPEPLIGAIYNTTFRGYATIRYDRVGLVPATYYEGIGTWTGLFEDEASIDSYTLWDYCIGTDVNCNLTTSLAELNSSIKFIFFPNPFENRIHIESIFKLNYTQKYTLSITDIYGRVIKQLIIKSREEIINLSDLMKGIYFLKISTNSQHIIYQSKIIKQ